MPITVAGAIVPSHRERLETLRPTPAKAHTKSETSDWRGAIAFAVQRCFDLSGVSQKEAAALLERDHSQVARWMNGDERPLLDALFAVDLFRKNLIIALAELANVGLEIETVIRIRRAAR